MLLFLIGMLGMAQVFNLPQKTSMEYRVDNPQREGRFATTEKQTSKIPGNVYLWTGLGMLAGSVVLQLFRQKHAGLAIGQWAAPLLVMGMYKELVKKLEKESIKN